MKEKGWHTIHSHFYLDYSRDLTYKELDIQAFKLYDNFIAELFIECKHSERTQWVFFIPENWGYLSTAELKFLPRKHDYPYYVSKRLDHSIFNPLKNFCDFENIALNSAVFQGDKQCDNKIRIAINQCICAL